MGRQSLLEKNLTNGKVLEFLLQREDAAEKLSISRKLLLRLYKSKQTDRKKNTLKILDNLLMRLCSDSCDNIENLKKLHAASQKCSEQTRKRVEAQELLLEEKRKNKKFHDIERRLLQERKLRYRIEADFDKLLQQNTELEKRLETTEKTR